MSDSFEFREVVHFTAGAVGDPGQRIFYLQLGDGASTVTVRLEKQQVQALAQYLKSVLEDFPSTPQPAAAALIQPTVPEWIVGQIAVAVDEADAQVVIVIEELQDAEEEDLVHDDFLSLDEEGVAKIRAHVGVEMAAQFIVTSDELMSSGRRPCRLCGQPLDPAGHACPRLN